MTKPSKNAVAGKPKKPHADFPLFPHATGRWAKKVRGRMEYFGPWDKPQEALAKWLETKDDLLAGRRPRPKSDGLTVRDLLNRFMTSRRRSLDSRELTERTYNDYYATCERLGKLLGLTRVVVDLDGQDFEALRAALAKGWPSPVTLHNEIIRMRTIFKYGFVGGLIDKPVQYGAGFKLPSKKTIRAARLAKGPRMFEAVELRRIIDAAPVQLKAMILLGVNCGYGNHDVATLPLSAVDLDGGWVKYPRPKTAIKRRCPLWPETVAAIKAAIAKRPTPKDDDDAGLLFITKYGLAWHKNTPDNPISKETVKLLQSLGMHRPGLAFYALRHTFETIGGDSRDQVAVNAIMGHSPSSDDMSAVYRERIDDDRLRAVVDHVRAWLWPPATMGKSSVKGKPEAKPARSRKKAVTK